MVEPLAPGGELIVTPAGFDDSLLVFAPIEVHGDFVYFGPATESGGRAIARLPIDGAWEAKDAEIIAAPEWPIRLRDRRRGALLGRVRQRQRLRDWPSQSCRALAIDSE